VASSGENTCSGYCIRLKENMPQLLNSLAALPTVNGRSQASTRIPPKATLFNPFPEFLQADVLQKSEQNIFNGLKWVTSRA
jgi:hypothetical protein